MISIGIPTYKTKYLKTAIESVLRQTFSDFELIIVNSYGNVEIREIVAQFDDKRIRYYENNEFLDIVDNWNRVLSFAKSEYFILFSDDDVYEDTFLQELMMLTDKYPKCNIFYCRTQKINSLNEIITYSALCPEYENGLDFIWGRLIGGRQQFAAEFMCKTHELNKIGGFYRFPLAWGTDDVTWFRLAISNGIVFSAKPLFNFRVSDVNISTVGNVEKRLLAIQKYKEWITKFLVEYAPTSKYEENIINNIFQHLDPIFNNMNKNIIQHVFFNKKILTQLFNVIKLKRRFKLKLHWVLSACYYAFNQTKQVR